MLLSILWKLKEGLSHGQCKQISNFHLLYLYCFNKFANASEANRCVSIVDDVKRLSCYDSLFIDESIEPEVIELDTIKKSVETLKKTESELEDATIKAAQDAYNQVIEDAKAMVVAKVTEGRE